MSEGLTFASPAWGHWLWLVLGIVIVALVKVHRQRAALRQLLAPALTSQLASGASPAPKIYRIVCLALAMVCMVLALMRPQMGLETVQQNRTGAAIMIALDVSRSMLASDVVPNRLERAKAEINDLLTLLRGDQVGLIAFAGRAAILAPLTPDFGFIRLALDDAGPGSVSRGGTRLEEPIRKAVDGFKGVTDASRSIILITDGEDHESFAREAATYAAERGVRILAIGLGDPGGTTVQITDPATGAVQLLEDADGNPVTSRLDSALLAELALKTDGAYVPAGTAALELDVIYQQHIAPLTRAPMDARERVVKRDLYQWFVLNAVAFIVLGLMGAATRESAQTSTRTVARGAALVLGALVASAGVEPASAQVAKSGSGAKAAAAPANAPVAAAQTDSGPPKPQLPANARDAYNAGVDALAKGELDTAESLFEAARSRAGTDAAVRFSATFNLAWVALRRANALQSNEPQQALTQLQIAIERWQQALALRKDDDGARANIAVAAKRALILEDQLAKRAEGPLGKQIEALIGQQRTALATFTSTLTQTDGSSLPSAEVRRLNVLALGVASELQRVLARVARDLGAAGAPATPGTGPDDGRDTPSPQALEQILGHLGSAQQALSQGRAQIRKRALARAVRRAVRTLHALEDAREVLFELRERIDAVYGLERLVESGAASLQRATPNATMDPDNAWRELKAAHRRNESRLVRLGKALSDAQAEASEQARTAPANPPAPNTGNAGADKAHLEAAYTLWTQARDVMYAAGDALGRDAKVAAPDSTDDAQTAVVLAVQRLQALRRHFFSVLEHLQETRDQQVELTTRTAKTVTSPLDKPASPIRPAPPQPPLTQSQTALAERATHVAAGLRQMAKQGQADPANGAAPAQIPGHNSGQTSGQGNNSGNVAGPATPASQDPERLTKAAGLVDNARTQMTAASTRLAQPADTAAARTPALLQSAPASTSPATPAHAVTTLQTRAQTLLTQALELLQDKNEGGPDNPQQQGNDNSQNQAQQDGDTRSEAQAGSGLLQGVRDREAQRRARKRARARGHTPVAKDW
jgi:Ca-activated chloride channel homolog